jgi:hypothetical protein
LDITGLRNERILYPAAHFLGKVLCAVPRQHRGGGSGLRSNVTLFSRASGPSSHTVRASRSYVLPAGSQLSTPQPWHDSEIETKNGILPVHTIAIQPRRNTPSHSLSPLTLRGAPHGQCGIALPDIMRTPSWAQGWARRATEGRLGGYGAAAKNPPKHPLPTPVAAVAMSNQRFKATQRATH